MPLKSGCGYSAFEKNRSEMYHKFVKEGETKKKAQSRALAAAFTQLKESCGTKDRAKLKKILRDTRPSTAKKAAGVILSLAKDVANAGAPEVAQQIVAIVKDINKMNRTQVAKELVKIAGTIIGATKEEIAEAKKGVHKISWQPGEKPEKVTVVKVEGQYVWVKTPGGETVKLNGTASAGLLAGEYR